MVAGGRKRGWPWKRHEVEDDGCEASSTVLGYSLPVSWGPRRRGGGGGEGEGGGGGRGRGGDGEKEEKEDGYVGG
uniref:Uncharacterized protein n=1 Tax=Vespula pensylvanica TaxID=30213 RepID=A0A834PG16_VESPE|nr:hypothetical protein H0235_001405 [Vespula pensylvanica]